MPPLDSEFLCIYAVTSSHSQYVHFSVTNKPAWVTMFLSRAHAKQATAIYNSDYLPDDA